MVTIFSPEKFNSLNIDSVERAIVFSGMVLQAACAHYDLILPPENKETGEFVSTGLIDKVTLRFRRVDKNQIYLVIKALIPYSPYEASRNGGFSFSSVKNIVQTHTGLNYPYNLSPNLFNFPTLPSNPLEPVLPVVDYNLLDSFEKYYLYHVLMLLASLDENRNEVVTWNFDATSLDVSEIDTQVVLPLNIKAWASGANNILAVKRVTNNYDVNGAFDFNPNFISLLDDGVLLDDNVLFKD